MINILRTAAAYLNHRMHCANRQGHGVHSPFLFDFITRVLPDTTAREVFEKPERYRHDLLHDRTTFSRIDLGSGSRNPRPLITIRSLARRALQPPRGARLLYRLVKHYHPQNILELGTCLGVTTEYLASAGPDLPVYTMEGDPFLAQRAAERFRQDGFNHIETIVGNFDEKLSEVLSKINSVGLVWLDGNHRQEPTLRYFEQLLPYTSNASILVFDDIYWSAEMEAAWRIIQRHPRVRATLDLFRFGIVFFRSEFREPVHLRLHY